VAGGTRLRLQQKHEQQRLFEEADTDHSNTLTFEEFAAMRCHRGARLSALRLLHTLHNVTYVTQCYIRYYRV